MKAFRYAAGLLLLLCSCSDPRSAESAKDDSQGSAQHSVLKDYVKAPLDKAKGVGELHDQHNKALEEFNTDQ